MIEHDEELPAHLKSALNSIIDRPLPRIQEDDFVRFFLSGFAGKIENVQLDRWLDVAGNSFNPVEVCKGDEVLYVVPPLLGEASILPGTSQAFSMSEIIARTQKLNRIHPRQGEEYMQQMLKDRIKQKDKDFETIRQWNSIFARYGLDLIPIPGEAAPTSVQAPADDKPVYQEFEDL